MVDHRVACDGDNAVRHSAGVEPGSCVEPIALRDLDMLQSLAWAQRINFRASPKTSNEAWGPRRSETSRNFYARRGHRMKRPLNPMTPSQHSCLWIAAALGMGDKADRAKAQVLPTEKGSFSVNSIS
jgi:hypothetical protein